MKRCFCLLLSMICAFGTFPLQAETEGIVASPRKEAPPKYPVTELAVPDSVFKDTERHWMGVYFNGAKCGWSGRFIGPDVLDGKKCITAGETMVMEMKVFTRIIRTISTTRTCYSTEAPYRALLMESTEKRGGQERHILVRNTGNTTYTVDSSDGGKPRPQESAKFDARLCQETTTGVWAADPARKPGDAITVNSFSIGRMKFGEQTVAITKEADWESSGGKLRVWETSLYDFGDGTETFLRISRESGSLVSGRYNSTIEFREEPEEIAKKIPAGERTDLFFATAISADKKLTKTGSLSEIVLELTAPEGRSVPELPNTPNQTIERKTANRVIVKTGPGTGPRQSARETDRAGFLRATARYPLADEAVKKLAARAVFGAKNDRTKVERLRSFTRTFIQPSAGAKPLTVMDVIQSKKGDCTAYALLFTTLARAAGIPAREAGGWMYMGDEYQAFGFHAWNEVILDGHWVPVDASCKSATFDASHIQECSADGEGSKLREMVPGLKARVISCKVAKAP